MSLSLIDLKRIIKAKNPNRYKHILGTFETATYLAKRHQVDEYKCQVAALLHDYAKNEQLNEMQELLKTLEPDLLNHSIELFHGPVGAYLIEKRFNIKDEDILNAIKYHVTGHPNMNEVAKVVYIADYIEPGRKHNVSIQRQLADISLDMGVISCSEGTMNFLNSINESIHPLTLKTYQTLLKHVGVETYEITKNNCKRH
ncbi:bis(5'-nucleosyl)-tetraphosphatase (symmetrical) YqeK [Haloplasma contractile]|uniref:bis(5'-nucleosyl)-tetraphosphatase (symmetrical) n=1 Tax=Haloplasma contractile SSD-17B TaxID=1033810 RepID=U2EFL7_9MOLU|nr:bis(5'-nucleosyl)-tetraphosphatase (symmetrical) YqeK [Haloplasma contractile]ERJ13728.1 nicotinate-nucleotide adenylyltransferase protein [Haloplasma contractile SSD-17B]